MDQNSHLSEIIKSYLTLCMEKWHANTKFTFCKVLWDNGGYNEKNVFIMKYKNEADFSFNVFKEIFTKYFMDFKLEQSEFRLGTEEKLISGTEAFNKIIPETIKSMINEKIDTYNICATIRETERKRMNAFDISTIVNIGTLTSPTSTDMIVGRATTDKVLDTPEIPKTDMSEDIKKLKNIVEDNKKIKELEEKLQKSEQDKSSINKLLEYEYEQKQKIIKMLNRDADFKDEIGSIETLVQYYLDKNKLLVRKNKSLKFTLKITKMYKKMANLKDKMYKIQEQMQEGFNDSLYNSDSSDNSE